MSIAVLVKRILVLFLTLATIFGVLGFSVDRLQGLLIGEVSLIAALGLALFRSEASLRKAYRTRDALTLGVSLSLSRVIASLGGPPPKVALFDDPTPHALVARSLGSRGTIILSEGLLGLLSEEELRHLLRVCILRSRARGIAFQTLCGWLAHRALGQAPRPWVELIYGELAWHERLGPFGALHFLVLFAIAGFFSRLGRAPCKKDNASLPVSRFARLPGLIVNPGAGLLHISDPWGSLTLFRL